MPLLSRRCAAEKSSLRSLNALPSKAFRAFDPTRGGLPPPRAPPPTLGRIRLNRGFSTRRTFPAGPALQKAGQSRETTGPFYASGFIHSPTAAGGADISVHWTGIRNQSGRFAPPYPYRTAHPAMEFKNRTGCISFSFFRKIQQSIYLITSRFPDKSNAERSTGTSPRSFCIYYVSSSAAHTGTRSLSQV